MAPPTRQVSQEGNVLTRKILERGELLQGTGIPCQGMFKRQHGVHLTFPTADRALVHRPEARSFLWIVAGYMWKLSARLNLC